MLELQNVSFQVTQDSSAQKEILKDISLTIAEHQFVAVTGPNGGGKSTLAKLIMGIEKPTSGRIFFQGEDITDLNITERAEKGISFAFQQPVRFKGIKVKDLISLASGNSVTTSEACEYLSKVGLCAKDYISREVDASLSGGELKRIEIAMVIARGTPLSVFDEPEAGIDLWSFQNLINVFEQLKSEHVNSLVVITHQERILKIADQILVLAGGRIQLAGSKDEILPGLVDNPDSCALLFPFSAPNRC
ncbi:MAG: ATP-binding cassette domain-containing protein [Clostridium sp.]|jgi:Fe-S cluster assembly ATP-binding protein|nr:ATP-binding cassette domain-containing protein [Clostridium sp.]